MTCQRQEYPSHAQLLRLIPFPSPRRFLTPVTATVYLATLRLSNVRVNLFAPKRFSIELGPPRVRECRFAPHSAPLKPQRGAHEVGAQLPPCVQDDQAGREGHGQHPRVLRALPGAIVRRHHEKLLVLLLFQ